MSEYQPSSSCRASKSISRFFSYINCKFCSVCPTTKITSATVKPLYDTDSGSDMDDDDHDSYPHTTTLTKSGRVISAIFALTCRVCTIGRGIYITLWMTLWSGFFFYFIVFICKLYKGQAKRYYNASLNNFYKRKREGDKDAYYIINFKRVIRGGTNMLLTLFDDKLPFIRNRINDAHYYKIVNRRLSSLK